MTKQKLNIARLVMAIVLVVSLATAVGITAYADEAAVPQTREFNKNFDRMLDDGTGEGVQAAYRSVSWEAGACADPEDHPIFKLGAGALEGGFLTFSIELRSPDSSVTLADLRMALRDGDKNAIVSGKNDAFDLSEIAETWLDIDGDITNEWTTLTFKPSDGSIKNEAGKASSETKGFSGFHLYSVATKGGKLDIRTIKVGDTTVYNFAGIDNTYWKGSDDQATVADYPNCHVISASAQIKSTVATSNNTDDKYDAIVLRLAGTGTVTVAPIVSGQAGTAKAWTALTDMAGTAVSAIGADYVNHVISLSSLGETTAIEGVEIAVTGGTVYVAQAFFTNMESRPLETDFPVLDVDSISYVSQFSTETTTKGSDQFESIKEVFAGDEYCEYALSDSPVKIDIVNGHAVLDAKDGGYTNLKVYAKNATNGRKYLVIKYKLENNATLEAFRFGMVYTDRDGAVTGEKWVKDDVVFVGFGLPSTSEINPYKAGNGYEYMVVDLESTFGDIADSLNFQGVNLYFGGAGQMLIDEIYFADPCFPRLDLDHKVVFDNYDTLPAGGNDGKYYWTDISDTSKLSIVEGALKVEVPASTPVCVGGASKTNNKDSNYRYMVMRMKSENLDMSTFSIVWSEQLTSYANAGDFVTLSGKEYVLGEEYSDFIIDLEASGIDRAIEGYRLWVGGGNDEAGALYIDEVYFADALPTKLDVEHKVVFDNFDTIPAGGDDGKYYWTDIDGAKEHLSIVDGALKIDVPASTALCIGGASKTNNKDTEYPFMVIRMKSENFDMSTFRIIWTDGVESYFNQNKFVTLDNVPYVLGDEYTDFIIDLSASGINRAIEGFRLWVGGWNEQAGALYIDEIYFTDYLRAALPTNDDTKPVISQNIATTGKVGTEITLSATATDNYDDSVNVTYSVVFGSTPVTVTNGKFTPTQAGTYSVTVTATDAAGNVATETVAIAVAAEQTTEPTTPEPKGLSTGAIVGIVLGCVAVVAAGVVAFVFIRKKKTGK